MGLTWALSDGRAGNARQAEALARALQPDAYQPLHLEPNAPWRWAAPWRLPAHGGRLARHLPGN